MTRPLKVLEGHGIPRDSLTALNDLVRQHKHEGHKGGQHTNGGCHGGRCDFGSPACSAWTALLEVVGRHMTPAEEVEKALAPVLPKAPPIDWVDSGLCPRHPELVCIATRDKNGLCCFGCARDNGHT